MDELDAFVVLAFFGIFAAAWLALSKASAVLHPCPKCRQEMDTVEGFAGDGGALYRCPDCETLVEVSSPEKEGQHD